jgi:predicted acyltransferase
MVDTNISPSSPDSTSPTELASGRRVSIDAYRGMVMFLMLAEVLHLDHLSEAFPGVTLFEWIHFHTTHVDWEGCSLHDLIQPGFTFLVGVAMPFSIASRMKKHQSATRMLLHAAWRSVVLICLGIMLRSLGQEQTYFTFEDTLTQIGLGYFFVFLIALAPRWVHFVAAAGILVLFWAAYAVTPPPPPDFDYAAVGVPVDWPHHHEGFAARWNKNSNLSWQADVWFLNLFPRSEPFKFNDGGYATLSFVPTMVTMLFGLIAGGWLKQPLVLNKRLIRFGTAIVLGIGLGLLLARLDICPSVKRIWTPSFALFSGGCCMAWLLALHLICDVGKWQRWAFPFVVIGANSILIYVMSWTLEKPIHDVLLRHFGTAPFAIFGEQFISLMIGVATLAIMFYVLLWLYRHRVFIKI